MRSRSLLSQDLVVCSSVSSVCSNARFTANAENEVNWATKGWEEAVPLHHCVFGCTIALFSITGNGISSRCTHTLVLGMVLTKRSSTSWVCYYLHAVLNMTMASCYCWEGAAWHFTLLTLDSLNFFTLKAEAHSWSTTAIAFVFELMVIRLLPRSSLRACCNSLYHHWGRGHHHLSIFNIHKNYYNLFK